MTTRVVLDTNLFGYAPVEELKRLTERGLLISISEIALSESWARSVREYQRHGMQRARARGKFFKRAKAIAPYLDARNPVAAGAGAVTRRVAARTSGAPPDRIAERQEAMLHTVWRMVVGRELTDEEWINGAKEAEDWLTKRDAALKIVVEETLKQKRPSGWETMPDVKRMALVRASLVEFWRFTPAMAERLDAHASSVARRMLDGYTGARLPKENDGADLHLTQHLGEDCVVATADRRLIDIVDRSGSFQAPWVRQLDDLDDWPEGPPWGDSARRQAAVFKRRSSSG